MHATLRNIKQKLCDDKYRLMENYIEANLSLISTQTQMKEELAISNDRMLKLVFSLNLKYANIMEMY